MNPVFIFLVLIAAFLLWAICSYIFYPIGKFITNRAKKVKDCMDKEDEQIKENEQKEEE